MSVEIRAVSSGRDLRRFVRLPFSIYKGCEQWVPPLIRDETKKLTNRHNPSFDHCVSRFWLAFKDGRAVGRIAGIINQRAIEKWGKADVRFGFLEFTDDPSVSAALFHTVEQWAAEHGMTGVHGPMGFTGLDPEGMLVEGFDELGTMTEIYNHAYYPRHVESLGYEKVTDWVEYDVSTPDEIPDKAVRVGKLVLKRSGLHLVEAQSPRDLVKYVDPVFDLVNEAYAGIYGTVELTREQVSSYTKRYFRFLDPRFNKFIVDDDGELVAFGLIFPSLAAALRKANGRLFPFGFVHLNRAIKHPKRLNLGLIAVTKEHQGGGVPAILFTEAIRAAIECGITGAETGRELESNTKVRSLWKSFNARQHKRRRVYRKDLNRS